MTNCSSSRIDIFLSPAGPLPPFLFGSDVIAMVNRHHQEVKELYRKAQAGQLQRKR